MAKKDYSDIIHLSRPPSNHPKMANIDRAAQFAPFAALQGHQETMEETARLTETKRILDENQKEILDHRIQRLSINLNQRIVLTYFKPDSKKSGGQYITCITTIRKIDEYEHVFILEDGQRINIEDIYEIEFIQEEQEVE